MTTLKLPNELLRIIFSYFPAFNDYDGYEQWLLKCQIYRKLTKVCKTWYMHNVSTLWEAILCDKAEFDCSKGFRLYSHCVRTFILAESRVFRSSHKFASSHVAKIAKVCPNVETIADYSYSYSHFELTDDILENIVTANSAAQKLTKLFIPAGIGERGFNAIVKYCRSIMYFSWVDLFDMDSCHWTTMFLNSFQNLKTLTIYASTTMKLGDYTQLIWQYSPNLANCFLTIQNRLQTENLSRCLNDVVINIFKRSLLNGLQPRGKNRVFYMHSYGGEHIRYVATYKEPDTGRKCGEWSLNSNLEFDDYGSFRDYKIFSVKS
jgi:hypothetical protein